MRSLQGAIVDGSEVRSGKGAEVRGNPPDGIGEVHGTTFSGWEIDRSRALPAR